MHRKLAIVAIWILAVFYCAGGIAAIGAGFIILNTVTLGPSILVVGLLTVGCVYVIVGSFCILAAFATIKRKPRWRAIGLTAVGVVIMFTILDLWRAHLLFRISDIICFVVTLTLVIAYGSYAWRNHAEDTATELKR